MQTVIATPTASGFQRDPTDEHPPAKTSKSAEDYFDTNDTTAHESDDEPMIYDFPRDYGSEARQQREDLLSEGADPDSIILISDLHNKMPPRGEDESVDQYTKRFAETWKAMSQSGIHVLNDDMKGDSVPTGFNTPDGRAFDLGPNSGATKGEYRAFCQWFQKASLADNVGEVPEKWQKFEKPAEART